MEFATVKTLLIDNYDSFTYNLYQLLGEVNLEPPEVVRNDEISSLGPRLSDFNNIVISPGPGRPDNQVDFGDCARIILETPLPILGVCLGHQGICHLFGAKVDLAPEPMHGRRRQILHCQRDIFAGIPSPFFAVRYHSLAVTRLSETLVPLAWAADGVLMGVRHRSKPIWGVQFHPESICTDYGRRLLANFRDLSRKPAGITHSRSSPPIAKTPKGATKRSSNMSAYSFLIRKLPFHPDPELAFTALFSHSTHSFWLDSSAASSDRSRFSYLGDNSGPLSELITFDLWKDTLTIDTQDTSSHRHGPFFEFLSEELRKRHMSFGDVPFDFNLGYVGFLGYELKAECGGEKVHSSQTPDAAFLFADRLLAIDHHERVTYLLSLTKSGSEGTAAEWLDSMTTHLQNLNSASRTPVMDNLLASTSHSRLPVKFRHDRPTYLSLIDECQRQIRNGESYEICLTNSLSITASVDPLDIYRCLRRLSPTPFSAFLRFPEFAVLSSSPERFLKIKESGGVEAMPIKGTRRRGDTCEEDRLLWQDLNSSEKDRAENLMIVDLIRNDLNSVCEIGSVNASNLFSIESFSTVHQLVSTIRGKLRTDRTTVDCVRAAFPGGSMTGAPKRRTMQILDRLEGGSRGIYSGALGYFALSGAADLSIVIRTIVATGKELKIGVGGAIVALSNPEAEFDETLLKAKALLQAIVAASSQKEKQQ